MVTVLVKKPMNDDNVVARERPERATLLSEAARQGEYRVSAHWAGVCRVGEIVILGNHEGGTIIANGSLAFRFPFGHDHPRGTVVRTMSEEEFVQDEEVWLCIYRCGDHDDVHAVCHVDLVESQMPEMAEEADDLQECMFDEDFEEKVQVLKESTRASEGSDITAESASILSRKVECAFISA